MRQTLRRFARLTAGYSLVSLAGPIATVLLTPLYTRALSPADYGVLDVSLTLSGFITVFVMLASDQALSAFYYDGDDRYRRDLVTTTVVYIAAVGLAAGLALAAVATPVAVFLFHDASRDTIIHLVSLNLVFAPVYGVISVALRLRMGIRRVNALGLAYLAALISSNVLMVLVLQYKATGIVAANVLTNAFACGVGLALARGVFGGRFSTRLLRKVLAIGLSLFPGALSGLVFQSADRLLLTQFVTQTDIGLYSIGNKLASMCYVLISPAWHAWWPMSLEMSRQDDAPRQYARMFEYFIAGTMFLALGLGLFAPEILQVFTREAYVPAAPYALVLMISSGPLSIMSYCFSISLFATRRTSWYSAALVVAALANVSLNLALLPTFGVWGAVWATVISAAAMAAILYWAGQRALHVPYRWARVAVLNILYLIMVAISLSLPQTNNFGMKIAALTVFVAAIFAVGIVTVRQVQAGLQSIRGHSTHTLQS